jgi:hypothetical protein
MDVKYHLTSLCLLLSISELVDSNFIHHSPFLVHGGFTMALFLLSHPVRRGSRKIKEDIKTLFEGHGNSSAVHQAVSNVASVAVSKEGPFWVWMLGNLRAHHPEFIATITMWQSFFLKTRGLSWLGMKTLCELGMVIERRRLTTWMKTQSMAVATFCR